MYMIKIKEMRTNAQTLLKRLAVGITTLLLASTSVLAQGTAEVWLNKASEKLQNKGTEISFRINEDEFRISGKLLMQEERFVYDTDVMKIWYDGITQWTLQLGGEYNELYINNPTTEEQQSINPYLLLNNYKKYFTATDGGERSVNGKLTHMVTLKPKDSEQAATSFNVYITSDGSLSAMEMVTPDGDAFRIEVRAMRNGLTFPKETFTYQPKDFPADEIIDMR